MNSCPEVKDAYEGVVAQVKDKKTPRTALAAFKKNFCVNQKYVFNETTARHVESYSRADHFTHEPKTFDQLVDIYKPGGGTARCRLARFAGFELRFGDARAHRL